MSYAPQSPPPPPQDYPPYLLPLKEKLWKRKWFQITCAALVAFLVGLGAGGSTEPTPGSSKAEKPAASATVKHDAALTKATQEAERLESQVAALRQHEKLAIAQVQGKARAAQRTAVRAATAQVRSQAQARQRRAVAAAVSQAEAEAATESVTAPADDTSGGGDVYYENCDAARAAGAAPISQGEPGYAAHLDRDGDGVGCDS
jgi:hypothetical protein